MRPDVRRWFHRSTSTADDWPVGRLRDHKQGTSVSVVLPALDEETTVGRVVECVRQLADATGLVDEIVVMDSGSTDRTAEVAAAAGARVEHRDDVLPDYGSWPGKGEVLWKSLAVTDGDLIVYMDADLIDPDPRFVTGLLGPLLCNPRVELVKGCYDRPLAGVGSTSGGRVTELMARPLLNAHFPSLAGVIQPLSGEYAARRSLLERVPFVCGYGVETGLLIDTLRLSGLDSLAQVDLGARVHTHQDTGALGRMAAQIHETVLHRTSSVRSTSPTLTQFCRTEGGGYEPVTTPIVVAERPPMISLPEYAARRVRVS